MNSTGLPRRQIKRLEKLVIVACFVVPGFIVWRDFSWLSHWLSIHEAKVPIDSPFFYAPWTSLVQAGVSFAALLWHGPPWLIGRWRLRIPPKALIHSTSQRIDLRQKYGKAIYAKRWVKLLGLIPGNQLHLLDTSSHEVRVNRLVLPHDGLRLGHLSDVHLTGYMHFDFYREAVDRLMATKPNMVLLTGDLIDYEFCLKQVQPLLESVAAPLGCYFVLGNHDRRLKNVDRLRAMLGELGWHDLGTQSQTIEHSGHEIYFVGNERPWFDSPVRCQNERDTLNRRQQAALRIGLSHSPDQIRWARDLQLDLLLCGHTHGGQVRLPWIGPVVAPSRYGSRFASGWFLSGTTLMHVSRGLSGTHPLRVACTPEVSSIVLRVPNA